MYRHFLLSIEVSLITNFIYIYAKLYSKEQSSIENTVYIHTVHEWLNYKLRT